MQIIGVLNITPDSFSDGGLAGNGAAIFESCQKMIEAGVDIIDIGAESTRPGAITISHQQEWRRLENYLSEICKMAQSANILTSIDTRNWQTAQSAINVGIDWINDVSGGTCSDMISIMQNWHGRVVIMHNLGIPADKNVTLPQNSNVVEEVYKWLENALITLEKHNIERNRIIIDPGIGFGKNAEQSWELINNIKIFHNLGVEILVGHSRKSFLELKHAPIHQQDEATLEVSKLLDQKGVQYIRVHNVKLHHMEIR